MPRRGASVSAKCNYMYLCMARGAGVIGHRWATSWHLDTLDSLCFCQDNYIRKVRQCGLPMSAKADPT